MTQDTKPLPERRANHYGEALALVRNLVAQWPGDSDHVAVVAARKYLKSACRSCGQPQHKAELCEECYRQFKMDPPPLRPVA